MITLKRVLFLIPHLGGGGAERVIAHLAGGLPASRYEIHLGLITQGGVPASSLPANVTVHALGASRVRAAAVPLFRLMWRLKPDLVFSGIFHLNFLVLLLRPLLPGVTRYVIRQNGHTAQETETSAWTRLLYRILYPRAEIIVCQSEAMAGEMKALLGGTDKLRVLPNPVDCDLFSAAENANSLWDGPGPNLLAIGRLTHSKGFDLLLPAFTEVLRQFPAANLTILGRGPEEAALKALAHKLGIDLLVHFAGYVEEPQKWFPGATAFVLSSRYEAMSNAMLEAAAAGLPIVATPALGGVETLLRGRSGTWVAREVSASALAQSLCAALASLGPAERVQHAWLAPHRMENALAGYERLFEELFADEALTGAAA